MSEKRKVEVRKLHSGNRVDTLGLRALEAQIDGEDGQNVSFLDGPDLLWHENPVERVIASVSNGT